LIKYLFIINFCFIFIYSSELYNNPYWLKLLHYKNNQSQIDDPTFFLSSNGKISPKDELIATLQAIKRDNPKDGDSTQCLFPARTRWLKKKLSNQNIHECKSLASKLKELNFKTLYLVYTSSYINSPASAFGHTFLRFDSNEDTPLLSYGLNYSAKVDSSNIFSYVYKGVFGGFEGIYRVAPYYEIVNKYSNMEKRDIWEYKLKFTPKEIERITLHMIEMQRYYSNYYFNSQNCSYNLLWFIDLVKDGLNLTDDFNYIVAPMDTIKTIGDKGLIELSIFRPSKISKIKNIYQSIPHKKIAKKFWQEHNISILNQLDINEQRDILDISILKENNQTLLQYRSKLGISPSKKITKTNPIYANLASKLNISLSNKNQLLYGIRASYHDIYDIDYDFNLGEYISFFDIQMINNRLDSVTFLKINSMPPIDKLYQPISWGVEFGYKDNKLFASGRGGISYSIFDTLIFFEPTIKLSNNIGFGYHTGMLKTINKIKFGVIAQKTYNININSFITYQLNNNMAINIYIDKKSHSLALFYYF
jgi:hypothetical protein